MKHMDSSRPVPVFPFVIGCGRSGTTLLRSMLDSHPDLAIPPETYFIPRLAREWQQRVLRSEADVARFVDALTGTNGYKQMGTPVHLLRASLIGSLPTGYADAIRSVYALYSERRGKRRYGDKTPAYVLEIDRLSALFPEAVFVHIIRDGRDVAMSFVDGGWADDLAQAVLYWKLQVSRGRASGRRLAPGRYVEIRYEDLVADPASTLSQVCRSIRLTYNEAMLEYRTSADRWVASTPVPERHTSLALRPTLGLRDWRTQMSAEDAGVLRMLAGSLLGEMGYPNDDGRHSPHTFALAGWRWSGWQFHRVAKKVMRARIPRSVNAASS
jgi:LPS sulfotransferase NodH